MSHSYPRHRFPVEIIQYCVWLYFTLPLSYRDVEKMMLYQGILVTYEAIRYWCHRFEQINPFVGFAGSVLLLAQMAETVGATYFGAGQWTRWEHELK